MDNQSLKGMLMLAIAGTMALICANGFAQVSDRARSNSTAMPTGGGYARPPDLMSTILRLGLGNPELRLTGEQRAEIAKLIDVYIDDSKKHPIAANAALAQQTAQAAQQKLTDEIGKVLNDDQRKVLSATQQRRGLVGGGAVAGQAPDKH